MRMPIKIAYVLLDISVMHQVDGENIVYKRRLIEPFYKEPL
jgi:hypothetical protein